jgi:hypothetical protein
MRSPALATVLSLALAALAAPACAQALVAETACVARAQEAQVRRMLATIPTSADEAIEMQRAIARADGCPKAALKAETHGRVALEARGLMAEALLQRYHDPLPETPPVAATATLPRWTGLTDRDTDASGAVPGAVRAQAFAGCLIRQNWEGVRAVLATRPGSPEERAALVAMQPGFELCRRPGDNFAMRPVLLRANLAEEALAALDAARRAQTAQY